MNGQFVCDGPARGDLAHWRFETVDVAGQLKAGKNVLAALVWNYGDYLPWNQVTRRTAFLVQGDGEDESAVNTGKGWKVLRNPAISPIMPLDGTWTGPCERVDGAQYPWGWEKTDFDDSNWVEPKSLWRAQPKGVGADTTWGLVPRPIPPMESSLEGVPTIRRCEGIEPQTAFLEGKGDLVLPKRTQAVLLLDQTYLTTAYPQLSVSGGEGSEIRLTYAEALVDRDHKKGNRGEIEGKHIEGSQDLFLPDGGTGRLFETLWFRTYRFIEMRIKTADAPLTIHDFHGRYTGYPFVEKASFSSSDPSLEALWKTGWRTARLCAGETYYDCPYYEQLQYTGDTRIQALISLYMTGDDRLMRNALRQYDDSRGPEGLTQSRYPNSMPQIIPPFSLFWVDMVRDYWMHRDDPDFVASFLPGIESVLAFHERHLDESGMLGPVPWWNFVDWTDQWPWDNDLNTGGVPTGAEKGRSSILTLQYVMALQNAADLFRAFHREAEAEHYRALADQVKGSVWGLCWDEKRGLLADSPDKENFSQHANLLAVLTDAAPASIQKELMVKVASDKSLIQCTYYYRFYLYWAMKTAGLGESYIGMLEPWREMLRRGLSTFAERPEPTRSDCHAWSASPNYELLASVCGIEPGSPGFKTVRVEPYLGPLTWVEGSMPHPLGPIQVRFVHEGESGLSGEVTLPHGLTGNLVWRGKSLALKEGKQKIKISTP